MKNFDSRVYSVSDFIEWNENGLLELSPDFQRRAVWTEKAKSYLIDTIIRGKPIPKILITQNLKGPRTIRTVVDGQQRLRTILEYRAGDFKLSRAHNQELGGLSYEMLSDELQDAFLQYELGVDILFNLPYEELLDIFARINSYTVTLNNQEKFNAKYLGYFKQAAYSLGYRYVDYFIAGGILTKAKVVRMAEAELTTDLLIAIISGVQTNKVAEQFYKKYEDDPANIDRTVERIDSIMSYIGAIYPPKDIIRTNWSRVHLFYTLFTVVAHCVFGITGPDPQLRAKLTESTVGKARVRLDEISAKFDDISADMENEAYPADYKRFITRSRRGTTDTAARIDRANFVCGKLKEILG